MKPFFNYCLIATFLVGTSFLCADEIDDLFSVDKKTSEVSNNTDSTSPRVTKKGEQSNRQNNSSKNGSTKASEQSMAQSVIYDSLKNMEINSRDAYDTLIELRNTNPDSIEPSFTIGLLFVFTKKDFQHAAEHFVACKGKRPEDTNVLINLGTVYLLSEKYAEGFMCYVKAYQLGTQSTVMSHNLKKFLQLSQRKIIKLPDETRKKFVRFSIELFKQTPPPEFGPNGWLFEPCPDGYDQEQLKEEWFKISDYECYEFPMCSMCMGNGKIDCPNPICCSGKVVVMSKKMFTMPRRIRVGMPVRKKVDCKICKGHGRVKCPICHGNGIEPEPED